MQEHSGSGRRDAARGSIQPYKCSDSTRMPCLLHPSFHLPLLLPAPQSQAVTSTRRPSQPEANSGSSAQSNQCLLPPAAERKPARHRTKLTNQQMSRWGGNESHLSSQAGRYSYLLPSIFDRPSYGLLYFFLMQPSGTACRAPACKCTLFCGLHGARCPLARSE